MRTIIALLLVGASTIAANAVTADQVKACEAKYRLHAKEAKAQAPAGYVPMPDKNRKPTFIAACLSE